LTKRESNNNKSIPRASLGSASGADMAVVVLDAFISNISCMLVTLAQEEVGLLLGIPGEIEKLTRMVGDIRCVLSDAERRQSESQTISQWVMELKDLMYDADDIIDLCQIKADERTEKSGSSSHFFNCCLSNPGFSHKIGRRIKVLNGKLENIVNRISLLGLIEYRVGSSGVSRSVFTVNRKTDPLIVQSDIVGEKVQEDTNTLVELITKEYANVTNDMAVIAIVGIGGIGKTTLAKKMFNDQRIKDEFQVKIWVCISKEVVERELLKNVIREAGGNHCAAQERSELIPLLERLIAGKKFLLVLDDVWRESEKVWHGLLREPFMSGARGSKIVVTTRDQTVAMRMKAIHSLRVDKLQDDDAWSLLIKQVRSQLLFLAITSFTYSLF
jgi:NB-ARC domain/Rx N-terminal domain